MKKSVLIPFERYLHYKSLVNNNTPPETQKEDESVKNEHHVVDTTEDKPQTNQEKLGFEVILSHLPKRDRSKALSLLNVVEQNPKLDWNNRGELLVNNSSIPYSHISDLIRDALHNSRFEPVACKEFYSNLDNAPLSLVSNPNRRILIGGKVLPPPGIPDKKPVPLNNWSGLWKSL